MDRLSYGIYILTARFGGTMTGCVINTACQVAVSPTQISIAVNKSNYTNEILSTTKRCNISILSEAADFDLIRHFGFQSGRDVDKFASFPDYKLADNGIPYITRGTNSYMSLIFDRVIDLGSHYLYIGKVIASVELSDVPSATYDFYHREIKPKAGRAAAGAGAGVTAAGASEGATADSAAAESAASATGKKKWRCKICNYEYEGDELPEDFVCPICKHPAEDFEEVE